MIDKLQNVIARHDELAELVGVDDQDGSVKPSGAALGDSADRMDSQG